MSQQFDKDMYVDRYKDAVPQALGFVKRSAALFALGLVAVIVALKCIKTVPAGHTAAATLFGEVQETVYSEGLHFPVNPLLSFTEYDARQKTAKVEKATIQTADQQTSTIDLSIQFRLDGAMAPEMLQNTGTGQMVLATHLTPPLRSILRERGKSVTLMEDLFEEATQSRLQAEILAEAQAYMAPQGIIVSDILIRHIEPPAHIRQAIAEKKKREQEVEKERANLELVALEQQQRVRAAEADRDAAKLAAEARRTLADAQAYEITKVREATRGDPTYVQLEALKALQAISKDPAAKIYMMNGDAPNPLPLMHMGSQTEN